MKKRHNPYYLHGRIIKRNTVPEPTQIVLEVLIAATESLEYQHNI